MPLTDGAALVEPDADADLAVTLPVIGTVALTGPGFKASLQG